MNNPRAEIGFSHGRITSIGMYLSAPLVDDLSLLRATAPSDPHSSRESMETVGGIIIVLGCNATAGCTLHHSGHFHYQLQLAPKDHHHHRHWHIVRNLARLVLSCLLGC